MALCGYVSQFVPHSNKWLLLLRKHNVARCCTDALSPLVIFRKVYPPVTHQHSPKMDLLFYCCSEEMERNKKERDGNIRITELVFLEERGEKVWRKEITDHMTKPDEM